MKENMAGEWIGTWPLFHHCNGSGERVVPHLNISDIPFYHCISSDKAVVSSSGNAVVHFQTTVPHLNISDIPFHHCFYTGLPLIYHFISTASCLPLLLARSSIERVNTEFTLHLHCITTGSCTVCTLERHCFQPLFYHWFTTLFPLLFLPGRRV